MEHKEMKCTKMTYEEAKAEFLSISGIRLQKWQEDFIDRLHENPKLIIKIKRGTGVDRYDNLIYLLRAIEDFRINEVKQKMTYEQAHKILEDLLRAMTYNRLLFSGDMLEAIGKAVEAVEYRMPKRPQKPDRCIHMKFSQIDGYTCFCPTCGENVHYGERCQKCGQTLDWSDEDTKKYGKYAAYMFVDEIEPKENKND